MPKKCIFSIENCSLISIFCCLKFDLSKTGLFISFEAMKSTVAFSEFDPADHSSWLKAIAKELGEKSIEDLTWKPISNLNINPYPVDRASLLKYPKSDIKEVHVGAVVCYTNDIESNKKILALLAHGANHITIAFPSATTKPIFDKLLDGVFLDFIRITFKSSKLSSEFIQDLYNFLDGKKSESIRVSLFENNCDDFTTEEIKLRVELCEKLKGSIHPFTIDGSDIQNRGADTIQVCAFVLLQAEFMIGRIEEFSTKRRALEMLRFHFAIGTNYFLEIAKIESIRLLWDKYTELYLQQKEQNTTIGIDSETELLTYSALDIENNILRATTAAMAAMIARVDSHIVANFDSPVSNKRSFSDRLSLNILHLLSEESSLNHLPNAVKGARYIEQIIEQLFKLTLNEIKENTSISWFETKKRFMFQAEENLAKRISQLSEGTLVSIGVNKFPKKNDPDAGTQMKITGLKRLSEQFENETSSSQL